MDYDEDDLGFLKGLYPELAPDQLLDLKDCLDGYFDVALSVFLRTQQSVRENKEAGFSA